LLDDEGCGGRFLIGRIAMLEQESLDAGAELGGKPASSRRIPTMKFKANQRILWFSIRESKEPASSLHSPPQRDNMSFDR
jgi:hypothetical protein